MTVVFVDGHFSHVNNLLLVRYCQDFFKDTGKRVEIFCLPVGQTNPLQPFDVTAFGGIKKKWHSYVGSRNALAGGMITKDNFLSHIVKLWFHKDGCPEKFAFRAGECLKSGFQKCGLFPFSPEVIRNTVKAHHDPNKFNCGVHIEAEREKDAKLAKFLLDEYDIVSQDKFGRIKEFILLTKQDIAPAAVLAGALQKRLFEEAPKKQRRPTNKQLDLQSGAMVTAGEFVEVLVRNEAAKAAEAAAKKAKRNAPEPKTSKKTSNSVPKKKMKTA
ncbi:hypothetical protein RvY_13961 [Ramazzottius varieornatus]|uniref:DDE-1 domain-containing protein n=1 Tax=Ramazzottius varieornatus TaxID=947166 RepID=A0A1D1VY71_RAMVA|nr:hypothetical protein RvY_13961 [Ramazzottius varieornatus]